MLGVVIVRPLTPYKLTVLAVRFILFPVASKAILLPAGAVIPYEVIVGRTELPVAVIVST